MSNQKTITAGIFSLVLGLAIAGGSAIYIFNKLNNDLKSLDTTYSLSSSDIVAEFLLDKSAADRKYLVSGNHSVILEIEGEIIDISDNLFGQKVVLLRGYEDLAGVSASFSEETSQKTKELLLGQIVVIKGEIRSGASYDRKLGIYDNIILEESDIVEK